MDQSSYIINTIILNVLIICAWVWLAVIKYQEKRPWHTYGCLVVSAGFCLFSWVNLAVLKASEDNLVAANYLTVYAAYLLTLGGSISFIINSYTKDHTH